MKLPRILSDLFSFITSLSSDDKYEADNEYEDRKAAKKAKKSSKKISESFSRHEMTRIAATYGISRFDEQGGNPRYTPSTDTPKHGSSTKVKWKSDKSVEDQQANAPADKHAADDEYEDAKAAKKKAKKSTK